MSDHNIELATMTKKEKSNHDLKRKLELQTGPVPQKRIKLEDILLNDINERNDKNVKCERRQKFLKTLQLKKRFKYHCKKHDSSYLIKTNRQKAKESVKERRFDLIQKFRSLNVAANQEISMETESSYVKQSVDEFSMIQDHTSSQDLNFHEKGRPTLPEYIRKTKRLLKNFMDSDDEDYNNNNLDGKLNFSKLHSSFTHKNNLENDSDSEYEKKNYRSQVLKSFTIQKNQGGDKFIFKQNDDDLDFIEIDCCEDGNSDCDCHYLDRLNDVTYYSSDDDF